MNNKLFGLLPLLAGLLAGQTAWSVTYKWVDENGVTIYSQSPPPGGSADVLAPPPPPAVDPAEARERLNRQLQRFEDEREDQEISEQKQSKQADKQAIYQANCSSARSNLRNLQGNPRKLMRTAEGTYERLTDERRQQLIEEAQQLIDTYCR